MVGEVTVILTVYASVFFHVGFLSVTVETVLFVLVIILNFTFLLYLALNSAQK